MGELLTVLKKIYERQQFLKSYYQFLPLEANGFQNAYSTGKLQTLFCFAYFFQEKRLSSICITEALVAQCHGGREYHI